MSLFLVMRRYDCSLKEFLQRFEESPPPWRVSLVVLTQLLEAVAHMVDNGVAHRDLKTDNVLMDLSGGPEFPSAVVSDFGCCLADRSDLRLPFPTKHVDRGGNVALMAPEVASASPGVFATIDYGKADLWAVGAMAYEMFGASNPFYGRHHLTSSNFAWPSDLPALPDHVPHSVSSLVLQLLHPDPRQRPSAELAATICQLLLWAPSSWWEPGSRTTTTASALQWLLAVTTKVMCESRFGNSGKALHEYRLVATFLTRLRLSTVKEAIAWLRRCDN